MFPCSLPPSMLSNEEKIRRENLLKKAEFIEPPEENKNIKPFFVITVDRKTKR
jgi:hypothetical protein